MKWPSPCSENPILYLPKLSQPDSDLVVVDPQLSLSVSDAFLQVWHSGADPDNPSQFAQDVSVLLDECSVLARNSQGKTKVSRKTDPSDLVTQVDQGIELIFRHWLSRHFPDHKVIGEEFEKDAIHPGDTVWYIDPIDGTNNFISGDNQVCLMVGCVQNGQPLFGYLNLFFFDTRYMAYAGCSNVFKRVSGQDTLHRLTVTPSMVIGVEYMPGSDKEALIFDAVFDSHYSPAPQLKSIGCNLIQIIEGRYSAFYKPIAKLWDVMPGLCILALCAPELDLSVLFPVFDETMSESTVQENSLFSQDPTYLSRLNSKHRTNGRVGLVTVSPNSQPDIKAHIQSIVLMMDPRLEYKS